MLSYFDERAKIIKFRRRKEVRKRKNEVLQFRSQRNLIIA